ncbi:winged helix-turn-helix transcriptional regulator [Shimazuella alba]|uniref:Transcriptional regulator n=1 Tax=Shimazuella alba TaxID=2690964 RepID=A0A6I4VLF4_9BACL|nr:helix-turn-helix domain-containing protein [Shimazuella alba]MXQ52439.1 transcriptional regulator [Shimazuella alba]
MPSKDYLYPIEYTLELIGGKWKTMILFVLMEEGTKRFGELRSIISGITQGVLTTQLRELEKHGLINRKIYPTVPPKVEYSLTRFGQSLYPVLKGMCTWGSEHLNNKKNDLSD